MLLVFSNLFSPFISPNKYNFVQSSNIRNEKGASFIETLIILPVLLLITTASVEMTRYLRHYSTSAQIAYEGARIASSWPSLLKTDISGQKAIDPDLKRVIQERLVRLANREKDFMLSIGNIELSYVEFGDLANDTANNSIVAEVNIPYTPVFNLWGKSSTNSRMSIAYLYPN